MTKYFLFTKNALQKQLTYRLRVVIWFIADVGHFLILPFLWLAVMGAQESIAGFSRADIVTYFVVTAFVTILATSHQARFIRQDIVHGGLNQHLVRPINYFIVLIHREFAYKIFAITFLTISVCLVALFFPEYLRIPTSLLTIPLMLFFLVVSYSLSFMLQAIAGLSSFWLGETSSLDFLRFMLEKVFGGEIAPLTFFPVFMQTIAVFIPFQFLYFIPAQVFLEKIPLSELPVLIGLASFWVLLFFLIVSFMWKHGVKHYEGSGI